MPASPWVCFPLSTSLRWNDGEYRRSIARLAREWYDRVSVPKTLPNELPSA